LHSMPHQLLLASAHTAIAATAASTHTAVLFLLLLQGPHHLLQIYCHLQLLLLASPGPGLRAALRTHCLEDLLVC
jgi:hypothetical protein